MFIKKIKALIFKNPLEFIFYLFVFLLPWQTRWIMRERIIGGQVFEYSRISLYGFDVVLIVLLVLAIFSKHKQKTDELLVLKAQRQIPNIKRQTLFIVLLFVIYCALTVFWSKEKVVSLYWGIRMLLGWGLFWLASQKINFSKVRLAVIMVISGAIQGLLAIWQFTQQSVWQSKWLGMAGQSARDLGTSVVEFGIERWLRAYGSLPHPNILGAWLVLSFVALIYLITKIKHKYHKLFLIFSASFISLGILFTYSRAAWLGFIGAYFAGAVWLLKSKQAKWLKNFAAGLLIYLVALLAVFSSATWPLIKTRLNIGPPDRLELKSNTERIASWQQAVVLWQKHRWWGVGIGDYTLARQTEQPDLKSWEIQPAHNIPLLILAELGIVGLVLFMFLNGWLWFYLWRQRQWPEMGVLFLVWVLAMFDHFWWTLGAGLYVWWLIMGLLVYALAGAAGRFYGES